MVHIKIPKDEKIEELLDSMAEHLTEMKEEASQLRKQGLDTTMVDVIMIDVMPKIKFARTTYETKDVDEVKRLLAQIRHEIDIVKTGTDFDDALQKIEMAYDKIREGDNKTASELYDKLRQLYKTLPEEQRRIVYAVSLDIHKKLLAKQE
ncbi:hypothetical protein HZB90_05060 [archaeon]|nr:hypothetical protein [archaeon]